ncbi:zinc ribbon domain-containing protein [Streptomyces sp. NPDC003717]|uniref:zinc ribbon domain-containing protein n=1 Tax=Streptomyces sp. NPDC003717 TaxID=3154276 RepID=UPI0033B89868
MTPTLAPVSPVARRAAVDLAAVREQWGDLLAAIGRRPAAEWPPRECAGFLDQLAAADHAGDDDQPAGAVVGRLPLLLREHPAPLNLDALDAAIEVEGELFDLADTVAERVQRPARPARDGRGRSLPDRADAADPARWHTATHRDAGPASAASAGSRAFGLHWAAVWLEGRALDETYGDLFAPLPALLLDRVAATARQARRTVERALGRDGRTTGLAEPCPWCGGSLTGRTRPGGEPVVTCSTGAACTAPADGRSAGAWRGADLVALWAALAASRERPAA